MEADRHHAIEDEGILKMMMTSELLDVGFRITSAPFTGHAKQVSPAFGHACTPIVLPMQVMQGLASRRFILCYVNSGHQTSNAMSIGCNYLIQKARACLQVSLAFQLMMPVDTVIWRCQAPSCNSRCKIMLPELLSKMYLCVQRS